MRLLPVAQYTAVALFTLASLTACGGGGNESNGGGSSSGSTKDTTKPVITLNGEPNMMLTYGQIYSEPRATATDNIDGNIDVVITGSVSTLAGIYTLTYNATDTAGNIATATRNITVKSDAEVDPFTLAINGESTISEAFLSHSYATEAVTVQGINTAVEVTITNGEFAIDGGEFSSEIRTVLEDQVITVNAITSADRNTPTTTTLNIGGITSDVDITTRSAEPSGIFTGAGTINDDASTMTLSDVKAIVNDEAFMLFSETENVLFDGTITGYNGQNFLASVDVYKNGINSQTVSATGTIINASNITLNLAGTGYGNGDLSIDYQAAMNTTPATLTRFDATLTGWGGKTKTVSRDENMGILNVKKDGQDTNEFYGGATGKFYCNYFDGITEVPNATRNIYALSFRVTNLTPLSPTCDHVGLNFTGLATIVYGGTRGTDGLMWFAASNGYFSSFSVLEDK